MHSVSGGGIGSNGYHWKYKNKVVERRTFGGGWGMYENVPKTREEKQKTENIPKIREGLLTPVATTTKGGRARGCRSIRTLLQSVPTLGLASCNISCSRKWSLVKEVVCTNSILRIM